MIYLIMLIPIFFFWRFRHTPLDRDYMPYAGPAVFEAGYLTDGFIDIKPPLIHWSYKAWLRCVSFLKLKPPMELRLLASVISLFSILWTGLTIGHPHAAILALLLISPTLWAHMANTECLTVFALSVIVAITTWTQPTTEGIYIFHSLGLPMTSYPSLQILAWVLLGLTPFINQKNLLLLVPVIWALKLNPTPTNLAALCIPALVILLYLTLTKRLVTFYLWCVAIPKAFGKKRTFKVNTLGHAKFLIPCMVFIAPFVASMDIHSRWTVVFAVMVAVTLWAKQVMPHHFILFAFPIAMASQPNAMTFVAFFIVWLTRDALVWYKPSLIYRVTFGTANSDYGMMMADANKIEAWLRDNTDPNEVIWVNGCENQIYLNAMRKPWRIEIPEIKGLPEGDAPKYIVHCSQSCQKFDYKGYTPKIVSTIGLYTLMVKE